TERGILVQGLDRRLQLGERVLLATLCEKIVAIVHIAAPAQHAALVVPQGQPEGLIGQRLQAVGGDVRDSLRQATSAAQQKGKQASKHGKPTAGGAHEYARRSGHMEEVGRSAERPQPSSGLFGVLSQTGVLLQYFQGSSMNLLGSDIGR